MLNIPWEDILFPKILRRLSLKDCLALREVSREYKTLVNQYFSTLKIIGRKDTSKLNLKEFEVLAKSTKNLEKLNLTNCTLNKACIKSFAVNNPWITHVNLSYTSLNETDLHPLIYCRELLQLIIVDFLPISSECLITLLHHLTKLECLHLSVLASLENNELRQLIHRLKCFRVSLDACKLGVKPNSELFDEEGWMIVKVENDKTNKTGILI